MPKPENGLICITGIRSTGNVLDGFIVTERYLLHRQGLFPNEVHRGPLSYQLDEATRAEIDRIYALLQETLARA